MANVVPDSFKTDLLKGKFSFDTSGNSGSTFYLALYTSSASFSTSTSAYSNTNEAVLVLDFGGNKTSTNGDFEVVFPAASNSAAIIRLGDA